ncbi:MAG TPA: hypothetical protein VFL71_12925, partial [Actinomycetes bacterium]|nr:hypothetical protein [Actinomycetes bacterium]
MRIRTRPRTIAAVLAAATLLLVSAPGLAMAAPPQRPSRPSVGLRPAKQATSFQRTTKAAATLAASQIRWELRNANTAGRPDVVVAYGGVTAAAVVTGDWDGNGSHTVGVVYARPDGQLEWQLRNANTPGTPDVVVRFGGTSSVPVTGDWDGNGTTTIGVAFARPDGQVGWHLKNDNFPGRPDVVVAYGGTNSVPVTGDWDGNRTTTIGVAFARSDHQVGWHLRN